MPTSNRLYRNKLYRTRYAINDKITINVPTIGDLLDNPDDIDTDDMSSEMRYNAIVSVWTSMPIDYMVELDDIGVDFTEITDYDLFHILFPILQSNDTSMIFGDIDFSKFVRGVNDKNGEIVLIDTENDIVIDRAIYHSISARLCDINNITKNNKRPAGKETKRFMLERARIKRSRRKRTEGTSPLETIVTAMVCTPEFKYDYETVKSLTIYQFNESARQIIKKVDWDKRMIGVYAGTVNVKELKDSDLNWLTHK